MKIGLISAAYPPDLDGIGDYTWWMARTLAERSDIEKPLTVLTRIGEHHHPAQGVEVVPFFDPARPPTFNRLSDYFSSANDLQPQISHLDWLILQYNPFSWGKWGFCPHVPRALRRLKQATNGPRLAVMFHETMVPPWPWRFTIMRRWQRPILSRIARLADVAFVSTERWIPEIGRVAPNTPMHHLPVGSNLPRSVLSKRDARKSLSLPEGAKVLGVFGGGHVSRRLDWIADTLATMVQRAPDTVLLHVGQDGARLRGLCEDGRCISLGVLPPGEAANALAAMDCLISPFDDGVSTRRGSVIAALQHGIPVATTVRPWSDHIFQKLRGKGMYLWESHSTVSFSKAVSSWLGTPEPARSSEFLRAFHEEYLSWTALADGMVTVLNSITPNQLAKDSKSFPGAVGRIPAPLA